MTTLDDNIKKANELYEQRQDEREAAGGGRVLSPKDAASMGASPHQAKMVGSSRPSALSEALSQAKAQKEVAQEDLLDAVMREKHFEDSQLTPAQKEAQKLQESMEDLGALSTVVQDAVREEFTLAPDELEEFSLPFEVTSETSEGLYQEYGGDMDQEAFSNMLTEAANFMSSGDHASAANIFNERGMTSGATTELLEDLYQSNPESVKETSLTFIANEVVDPADFTMKFLVDSELISMSEVDGEQVIRIEGSEDDISVSELEGIFGVNEDGEPNFFSMTPAELSEVLSNKILTDFHKTESTIKQINNPNISPLLREYLQDSLSVLEASGLAAIEQNAQEAADAVAAAGKVLFGGEIRDLEDLLDDSNVKAMAEEYLQETDPEKRKNTEFYEDNPAFANFIDNVMSEVMEASEDTEGGFNSFMDIQDEQAANTESVVSEVITLSNVDLGQYPKLMEVLGLGDDKFVGEAISMDDPIIDLITSSKSVAQSMSEWDESALLEFKDEWATALKKNDQKMMIKLSQALQNPHTAKALAHVQGMESALKQVPTSNDPEESKGLLSLLFGTKVSPDSPDFSSKVEGSKFDFDKWLGSPAEWFTKSRNPIQAIKDKLALEQNLSKKSSRAYNKILKVLNGVNTPSELRQALSSTYVKKSLQDSLELASDLSATRGLVRDSDALSGTVGLSGGSTGKAIMDTVITKGLFTKGQWNTKKLTSYMRSLDPKDYVQFTEGLLASNINIKFKVKMGGKETSLRKALMSQLKNHGINEFKNGKAYKELKSNINKLTPKGFKGSLFDREYALKQLTHDTKEGKRIRKLRNSMKTHYDSIRKKIKAQYEGNEALLGMLEGWISSQFDHLVNPPEIKTIAKVKPSKVQSADPFGGRQLGR